MTGWTMLNFEMLADYQSRKDAMPDGIDEFPGDWFQKQVHTAHHAIRYTANYHGTVVARVGGYRDWEQDLELAQSIEPPLWDRLVIVQANDTGDIGHAKLYEWRDGFLEMVDGYQETQDEGLHVGDKAAAAMFAMYNVPCLANTTHPYEHSVVTGEWSE